MKHSVVLMVLMVMVMVTVGVIVVVWWMMMAVKTVTHGLTLLFQLSPTLWLPMTHGLTVSADGVSRH